MHIDEKSVHTAQLDTQTGWGSRNSMIVMVFLLVGVAGVYAPQLNNLWRGAQSTAGVSAYSYVTDLDFWRRSSQEATAYTDIPFDLEHDLSQIPLTVGDWQGEEVPETNREVQILLEPEQYVRRLYQNSTGHYIWLTLIGGRNSRPFHAPDICYDADGWQFNMSSHPFALDGGGAIHALWLEAEKPEPDQAGMREHVVSYFYLFPNADRALNDGIVLLKLTSDKYGDATTTLTLHEDFVRGLFQSAD